MLPGPIFRREVKAAARPRDLFVMRIVLALLLGAIVVLPGLTIAGSTARDDGLYSAESIQNLGLIVFAISIGVEIAFLSLWAAGVVSSSITEEREKDTLPSLLLTRLTRLELVATKLAGGLMPPLSLILTGVPLLLVCAWCAGLPALLMLEILAVVMTSVIVGGSLAILASARRERSSVARAEALAWTFIWLLGVPIFTRVPARSGTLWGDLLVELLRLASWIAPSSPLSLLTDNSWFSSTSLIALSNRLVLMLVLQMVVIVLALSGAVASLRIREPHPNWWDPHRGFRPPVSDDPIYWREYVLPWRGNRLPMVVIWGRQILILVRASFLMILQLIFLTISVAVPIGLAIGALWFGYFAFRELWDHQSFRIGPYQARDRFNVLIRSATAVIGLFPLLAIPGTASGRFTGERDKKTWEPLLTTTLSGEEILSAKTRVTARSVWQAARWLIPLWLIGIACGALHPLGALVAAVELPLAAWAGLALGTWLGIRPGSTTQAANSVSSLWALGLMLFGGLVIVAPLCSVREFGVFWGWNASLRWLIVAMLLAAPPLTWALASSLTRRCYANFDEWVGRPDRASQTENQHAEAAPAIHAAPTETTVS